MKLQTFLDVLLVEEIPVADKLKTGIDGILRTEKAARTPQTGKVLSCDTKFPLAGVWVEMPYQPGDVVKTNEFGRNYILLDPEDEFRPKAKKYYLIRYADIEGKVVDTTIESGDSREEESQSHSFLSNMPIKTRFADGTPL